MSPVTAVVTIAHGRHRHLQRQHASLASGTLPDLYVVVAMADPTLEAWATAVSPRPVVHEPPRTRAVCRWQRLATWASARPSIWVPRWWSASTSTVSWAASAVRAYRDVVDERPDVLWSGPTTYLAEAARDCDPSDLDALDDPHPAGPPPHRARAGSGRTPISSGRCRSRPTRNAWAAVGGFCERYVGYGAEDTDLAHAWRRLGPRPRLGGRRTRLPPAPPHPGPSGAAPRRHPAQRGDLRRTLGTLADGGLARRVPEAGPRRAEARRLGAVPRDTEATR